ncbi:zinc-binding dehydrogenase [Lactobacillus acetotolerans]|uniref:Alcohol dehydrogenase n=1 Tax=Lactobacillus acetotolerans TaxID=1600 RepID=A0A0D6A359_9LACO|nr:zinc-binding dehydrogenase [Lactobacillus acetotolerans]KRN39413.1 nadph quinone reductase-like zn-dependent oxidoreductase [Lactobacillus acetotolerans DSM 20749 = JCM 3825]QFG51187.1 zinc-binding dehydrogenase [Lactobacillus acetotolerans]BAQ57134.1 alcohol dehydrogenase [Lactobacillus acetotolerans]GGV17100.1 NADPH:quinone reductase [Lactobacillus acetotolerans DSM 20749 = JCM 3825]
MKAIIQKTYQGIDDLVIQEVADPRISPMSAIVQTKYTPVLPYDWMTEEGRLGDLRSIKLPMTIGYSFSGIVEKVGFLRDKNLIGKEVIGASMAGSNRSLIDSKTPPLLFKVPNQVSLKSASTIIGGADAAKFAINKSYINKQDAVLITGASGGVGIYLIQLLKLQGSMVVALANAQNFAFLKNLGADYVIDYNKKLDFKDLPKINKVIDTVGSIKILDEITNSLDDLKIVSLSLTNYQPIKNDQSFQFISGTVSLSEYQQLLQMLADGRIKSVVQDTFNYRNVKKAQHVSKEDHSHGRILLDWEE